MLLNIVNLKDNPEKIMKHSFTIIVKKYKRENCTLDDVRVIYCGDTCIVAKNSKVGDLYLHKNASIISGKFNNVAGSVRYPILRAKTDEVHIRVENFYSDPVNIKTDQCIKQDIISIINHTTS